MYEVIAIVAGIVISVIGTSIAFVSLYFSWKSLQVEGPIFDFPIAQIAYQNPDQIDGKNVQIILVIQNNGDRTGHFWITKAIFYYNGIKAKPHSFNLPIGRILEFQTPTKETLPFTLNETYNTNPFKTGHLIITGQNTTMKGLNHFVDLKVLVQELNLSL